LQDPPWTLPELGAMDAKARGVKPQVLPAAQVPRESWAVRVVGSAAPRAGTCPLRHRSGCTRDRLCYAFASARRRLDGSILVLLSSPPWGGAIAMQWYARATVWSTRGVADVVVTDRSRGRRWRQSCGVWEGCESSWLGSAARAVFSVWEWRE
jgi:hypothetical protein